MLTRSKALDIIKSHCINTTGIEDTIRRATPGEILCILHVIENHSVELFSEYSEIIDFLDGNGFIVKKINNSYSIMEASNV